MNPLQTNRSRGVSPVIASVLMVAIVVVIAATTSVFFFDATGEVGDAAPVVGQSSGDLRVQDGADGGIVRVTHLAGESVDVSALEIAVDATDACGETARLVDLPSSHTGFASNEGFGDENFENDPTILAKSSPAVPPTWSPGVLHENGGTFEAGSWFEFRIKGGACPLDAGDEVDVRVVHVPSDSVIITQELTA